MSPWLPGKRFLFSVCSRAFLAIAAANVVVLACLGSYDFRLGPLHLPAHDFFKPLLILNGAFLLSLVSGKPERMDRSKLSPRIGIVVAALLVAAIYLPSLGINFIAHDWTHRHISAAHPSIRSLGRLFVEPQADGFYRPLGFISLWLDYRIFGDSLWAYHLQSISLHLLNSVLVAYLAAALGYGGVSAWGAALLFASAPAGFEPVVWPAARFDLLAAAFTLMALLLVLRYVREGRGAKNLWGALACFTLGAIAKESAYALLPMLLALWLAPMDRMRWWRTMRAALGIAAILTTIRIGIYGGLGGYHGAAGASPHFALTWKTFAFLFMRLPEIPLFAVNSSMPLPVWIRVDVVLYAILIAAIGVLFRARLDRTDLPTAALIFASAAPVLNLIGWVGPALLNARFVYLPGAFLMIATASAIARTRAPWLLLGAMVAVLGTAAIFNELAYPITIERTTILSGL